MTMVAGRRFIDCREYPSDIGCTMLLAADTDTELLDAAVQHAVAIHGHRDTPELRAQLRTLFKSEGRKP
jgi:predicted small metal-binding protein